MKFDIQHAAAAQTVSAADRGLEHAAQDVSMVSQDCDALAAALGNSPAVSGAVQGLKMEVLTPTSQAMLQQGRSATSNTSAALNHFMSGDQQMAQQSDSAQGGVCRPDAPGVN